MLEIQILTLTGAVDQRSLPFRQPLEGDLQMRERLHVQSERARLRKEGGDV